ncbi:DUF4097 family beta strand repeat-containing protein [Actinoplanes derwentensis]|uniref:Putative adhesin n=1 Tax=Actinoplanes derwentensis TaxID=113562 RepID=A0A1H2CMU3_9ACTN|nr:DUF4097 family beta strand repeat-containing protein [Actinoplanes derwentensis]GID86223.1 hypothetical protein Ade03nite_51470 [Actinoplanes derwentensis]SDT71855.1 Putative adhesin [Actinoplanes derwentensis]
MQTYATPAPVSAVLDIPAGRIQFIAADRADTTVEVRPANAAKSRDVRAAEDVTVSYDDGVLRIHTVETSRRFPGAPGSVEVTVQLPAGSRIEATAAAADLRGVGRLGDVTYDGAHGTVRLDETAAARLTLQSGDITVSRLGGDARISTQSGDITVGAAGDAVLDAGTAHGRIANTLRNTGGTAGLTIHATTANGDITAHGL